MFKLADTAFLNAEDRPETVELDQALLDKGRAVVQGRKRGGKSTSDENTPSPTKTKRNSSKKRKASQDESGGEDETGDVASDTDGLTKKHDHKKNKKAKTEV